jgi:tRNA pseudouridine13 synthase
MLTLSKSKGTGGTAKSAPEDFVVKEITKKGHVLNVGEKFTPQILEEEEDKEGKSTTFVLQKRDWDTVNALIRISKMTGHGKKSISYAGTKDRMSISVQLACIYGITPEQAMGIKLKDIQINGAWRSNGLDLGSNIGNAFTVMIRKCKSTTTLEKIMEELDGKSPNYFDRQRFGLRLNNCAVGMNLIKGDFKGALSEFLTNTNFENNQESVAARKKLGDEQNYADALIYFPKHLRNERSVIEYMSKYDNPANAMRKLPRGILMMFIHSVQSLIFNAALEERIKEEDFKSKLYCQKNFYGFPDIENKAQKGDFALGNIIGYETNKEDLSESETDVLERLNLRIDEFKIKQMPELSMKGSVRTLMMPLKGLKYQTDKKDIQLDFSIPSGSYATIFLNEITKSDEFDLKDAGLPK